MDNLRCWGKLLGIEIIVSGSIENSLLDYKLRLRINKDVVLWDFSQSAGYKFANFSKSKY